MSKARPQSQKRKMMRTLFGLQNENNSTKWNGKRVQAINIKPPKKRGRKSKRQKEREKWLTRLPLYLGTTKYIWHEK